MIFINTYLTEPDIFINKAEIIKALSNPQRLCMVRNLCKMDKLCVNDMRNCLGESQPNVSQHISKLKAAGIICGVREGKNIYYSLCDNGCAEIVRDVIKALFPNE